jgi:hypothetical protein
MQVVLMYIGSATIFTKQASMQRSVGQAKVRVAKARGFFLLFARTFPAMPNLFPVNFGKEDRQKPRWMLH